jgi:hypothetical protein
VSPSVRRLGAGEADLLRDLRLRALREAPMAFGSTLAREEAFEAQEWERWTAASAAGEDQATFIVEPAAGLAVGVLDTTIRCSPISTRCGWRLRRAGRAPAARSSTPSSPGLPNVVPGA